MNLVKEKAGEWFLDSRELCAQGCPCEGVVLCVMCESLCMCVSVSACLCMSAHVVCFVYACVYKCVYVSVCVQVCMCHLCTSLCLHVCICAGQWARAPRVGGCLESKSSVTEVGGSHRASAPKVNPNCSHCHRDGEVLPAPMT